MASVGSKDTGPELVVRKLLHAMGYRYSLHPQHLPGKPDIVLSRHKKIVLVHGCFWHRHSGCRKATVPKSNRRFWVGKFNRNRKRDKDNMEALQALGYDVKIVWQCETANRNALEKALRRFMNDTTED